VHPVHPPWVRHCPYLLNETVTSPFRHKRKKFSKKAVNVTKKFCVMGKPESALRYHGNWIRYVLNKCETTGY
jgi:hypothetical protein